MGFTRAESRRTHFGRQSRNLSRCLSLSTLSFFLSLSHTHTLSLFLSLFLPLLALVLVCFSFGVSVSLISPADKSLRVWTMKGKMVQHIDDAHKDWITTVRSAVLDRSSALSFLLHTKKITGLLIPFLPLFPSPFLFILTHPSPRVI